MLQKVFNLSKRFFGIPLFLTTPWKMAFLNYLKKQIKVYPLVKMTTRQIL